MRQLPGRDSIFLAMETDTLFSHIGGLMLLDPTDSPEFGFERFAERLAERIPLAPKFTWKLREVAFGMDRPYWVDDPHFDVRRHLHRVNVPAPGTMREVAELAGHLHARKLDREAPGPVTERMVARSEEVAPTIDRLIELHQDVRTARGDDGSFGSDAMRAFMTERVRAL